MTVLKVNDMHCEKCVERIASAFTQAGLRFNVKLEDKSVLIEGGAVDVQTAREALDDLGFEDISSL